MGGFRQVKLEYTGKKKGAHHCHLYAVKTEKKTGLMVLGLILVVKVSIRATIIYTNAILCRKTIEMILYLGWNNDIFKLSERNKQCNKELVLNL